MKRKPGERYANGRLKRPTVETLKQLEAERYRENMKQAGQQPHRREFSDPLHPWLESEFGRFCMRHGLRRELFDAGNEWAEIRRSWNSAKGVPDPVHTGGMGSGLGPSEATVARWRRLLQQIEDDLYEVNKATMWATRRLCIDGAAVGREYEAFAIRGLSVVAVSLGRMAASAHPFVRAA